MDQYNLYWINGDFQGSVAMVPVAGGAPTTLAAPVSLVGDLGFNGSLLCWTGDSKVACASPYDNPIVPHNVATGQQGPAGVAVDATWVYWTDVFEGTIKRAPTGGGTPTTLFTGELPHGIAVDGYSAFWANGTTGSGDGTIRKGAVAGGGATTLASGQGTPLYVLVDGMNVYWDTASEVASVPKAGGSKTVLGTADSVGGIALDQDHVYWSDRSQGNVLRTPTAGGNPEVVVCGQSTPGPVAVGGGYVYWANGDGQILRKSVLK